MTKYSVGIELIGHETIEVNAISLEEAKQLAEVEAKSLFSDFERNITYIEEIRS